MSNDKYHRHPVVIIGAGFSGLTALKTCKENRLKAICYEKTDNFGGLWRFREDDVDGIASVTRTTIINTSKEMTAFSDFPPAKSAANFMHNSHLIKYLEDYANKFDLFGDVHFGREVTRVEKSDNFTETGEWTVHVRHHFKEPTVGFQDEVQRASAVLVCIGHHVHPNIPTFPGQSEFGGKIIHTHSYKNSSGFENRNVLVVGIGNSGMDAAQEISLAGSTVYLSTRRGAWVMQRLGKNGLPIDFSTTRYSALIYKLFPKYYVDKSERMANERFDHEMYNLKPKHRFDNQHRTFGDMLPSRIIGGAIVVKGDVHRFTQKGVVFKGEEDREYPMDAVILATGYNVRFPFVADGILGDSTGNRVQLYRRIIPKNVAVTGHPTLGFIGFIQLNGAIIPTSEMQSRWMARLLNGEIELPPADEIRDEVRKYDEEIRTRYVQSPRHTFEVEFVPYLDTLAEEVGCKPNLFKLFFTDYELFRHVFFGPAVTYQYRLTGSHAWSGAREAIVTVHDRAKAPFQTRVPTDQKSVSVATDTSSWFTQSLAIVLPCAFAVVAYYTLIADSIFV